MIKGVQSIAFKEQPYIIESASVVGKKEGEGPLGAMFDVIEEENLFGEDTWEVPCRKKHVRWRLERHI